MSSTLPMVFQTDNLPYEDRFSVYQTEILGECGTMQVSSRIKKYVAQKVNPGGWKAIWRSTPASNGTKQAFDVVVEVNNVNVDDMTADITICEPVVGQSPCNNPQLKIEVINQNLSNNSNAVPIAELFPVYDESGENDETALAIEHVRFFYDHIWREWDEDDDSDGSYSARYLETRLRLYYDMQDGTLPKELIKKYRETYNQYKMKLAELEQLRKQMSASDSEQELDDLDVLKCAQKTEECNTLVNSLQMMENPQMRYLLAAVSPAAKAALRKPKGPRLEGETPVIFIVATKMTAGMVKSLPDDKVIEHCKHLAEALEVYHEGDLIHVHPGTYGLDGTVNLTDTVHITGIGDSNRILVLCEDDEDFSIDCYAPGIHFKNITFEQEGEGGPQGMLVIKQGDATLVDCQLKCGIAGITVKNEGNLVMKNCKVYDAKSSVVQRVDSAIQWINLLDNSINLSIALYTLHTTGPRKVGKSPTQGVSLYYLHDQSTGVVAQPNSSIQIEKCDFHNCGQDNKDSEEGFNSSAAVQLQQDSSAKPKATLTDNTIHNNSGYGVCVVRSVSDPDENPECSVNLDVTANKFRGNEFGDVGHIYLDTSI